MRINPRFLRRYLRRPFGLTACNSPNNSLAATHLALSQPSTAAQGTATALSPISPPTPSPEAPLIFGSYEELSPAAMRPSTIIPP
ncbi:MAG: hypothetical protein IPJ94_31165 [Chloroflexi bacterium]|nr:hypothetical protein [Chloroflexota bacterium]